MVSYNDMLIRLNRIARFYNKTVNPINDKLISKLILSEICGWIEKYVDEQVITCVKNAGATGKKIFEIVEKVHNVSYDDFQRLMIYAIGYPRVEVLENKLPKENQELRAKLANFKKYRNRFAHEAVENQSNIPSPSVLISDYIRVVKLLDLHFDWLGDNWLNDTMLF